MFAPEYFSFKNRLLTFVSLAFGPHKPIVSLTISLYMEWILRSFERRESSSWSASSQMKITAPIAMYDSSKMFKPTCGRRILSN